MVVLADARCSLCIAYVSGAAILALTADALSQSLWWIDELVGAGVAIFTLHQAHAELAASLDANLSDGGMIRGDL